jgi:hypothetical protein
MELQLRRVGWRPEFSPAIRPNDPAGFPSIGSRGCFLSHLATLKRGEITKGHILLMEDDLNFIPGFPRLWEQAYSALERTDWSIFYPGHTLANEPTGLTKVAPTTPILCAHFVMIHRDSVGTVIEGLETILSRPSGHPLGGPMHVDGAYSTLRQQNHRLNTYIFSPSLGFQRPSRSDISDLRLIDRIQMLRPVMIALRKIKQHLRTPGV